MISHYKKYWTHHRFLKKAWQRLLFILALSCGYPQFGVISHYKKILDTSPWISPKCCVQLFYCWFLRNWILQCSIGVLKNTLKPCNLSNYLLASSIATATATVILSLWVVTCADESHHLDTSGRLEYPWIIQKPCNISISHCKILLPNTSYSVFLKTLYRVLMLP